MFTGIVEEVGTLKAIRKGAHSAVLEIQASVVLEDIHLGDSIQEHASTEHEILLTTTAPAYLPEGESVLVE